MSAKKSKLVEIKTKQTNAPVDEFLASVEDPLQKKDSYVILEMMKKATGEEPSMWGKSLIGFGLRRYKSPATGREVDWLRIGFSPRKAAISLYLTMDIKKHADMLDRLGKHKTGVGCLYIKRLSDVDLKVLDELIGISLNQSGAATEKGAF